MSFLDWRFPNIVWTIHDEQNLEGKRFEKGCQLWIQGRSSGFYKFCVQIVGHHQNWRQSGGILSQFLRWKVGWRTVTLCCTKRHNSLSARSLLQFETKEEKFGLKWRICEGRWRGGSLLSSLSADQVFVQKSWRKSGVGFDKCGSETGILYWSHSSTLIGKFYTRINHRRVELDKRRHIDEALRIEPTGQRNLQFVQILGRTLNGRQFVPHKAKYRFCEEKHVFALREQPIGRKW